MPKTTDARLLLCAFVSLALWGPGARQAGAVGHHHPGQAGAVGHHHRRPPKAGAHPRPERHGNHHRKTGHKSHRPNDETEVPSPKSVEVSSKPDGPSPPSGTEWEVAYADGFGGEVPRTGAPDATWIAPNNSNGCCNNSDEIAAQHSNKVSVTSEGLVLTCAHETVEDKAYDCGGISGAAATSPQISFTGETLAIEWVGKLPPNYGTADPGVWADGPAENVEFDWPEFNGWGGKESAEGRHCVPPGWATCFAYWHWFAGTEMGIDEWNGAWGISEPDNGLHTYTTLIFPTSSGRYRFSVYIDGVLTKLANHESGCFSLSCANNESAEVTPKPGAVHLNTTYGLREAQTTIGQTNEAAGTGFPNSLTLRSYVVYVDSAHKGSGAVTNEGVVPGTVVK